MDNAILRAREVFEKSEKTLDELGVAMGYEGDVARKSAWQFLNKTADPRLSMLRRFAKAMEIPLTDLLDEGKKSPGEGTMTRRRRLLLVVASLVVIAAVPVVVWLVMPLQPGVTKANFDRIQDGMKIAEVDLILGGKGDLQLFLDNAPAVKERFPWGWIAADGSQAIFQIDDGVVIEKQWQESTETPTQRIRRWLHLPK